MKPNALWGRGGGEENNFKKSYSERRAVGEGLKYGKVKCKYMYKVEEEERGEGKKKKTWLKVRIRLPRLSKFFFVCITQVKWKDA